MKKINIILEQVLKRLIEAEEEKPAATPDSAADKGGESGGGGDEEKKLRDLLKQDYDTFVNKLKVDATDKKFQDAIKSLAGKNKIEHKEMSIKVSDLIPTQNEIDVDKSLKFPLTNPKSAKQCLDGGSIAVAGKRIITAGGGKYIIDGHHRWSQVCAMNPDAEIQAVDLSDITDPFEALKATQLGIAADIGKIETQSVKGTNLLKIGKDDLKRYVIATMTDDVAKVFSESGKVSGDLVAKSVQNKKDQEKPETPEKSEETPVTERAKGKLYSVKKKGADLIWRNVQEMQSKNQPVSGAPKRDIMPQTDNAKNWLNTAPDVADIKEQRALLMKRAGIKK